MNNFIKIKSSDIYEGICFSAPVFFDDGKNMFLAAGKTAKPYHIAALKRWNVPFVVTYGHEIDPNTKADAEDIDDAEALDLVEEV